MAAVNKLLIHPVGVQWVFTDHWFDLVLHLHFTFMHLSDAFIQSDLQCIQAIHFCQYVCSLGIEPMIFCAANAMLYNWATGTMVLIKMISVIIHINIRLSLKLFRIYYITMTFSIFNRVFWTGEWSISNSEKIYFWYFQSSRNVKGVILLEWYIIRIFVH